MSFMRKIIPVSKIQKKKFMDNATYTVSKHPMITEINEYENKYHQLFENLTHSQQIAQMGSWTHDIRTGEIFLSEEVYHLLGCTPEQFNGKLDLYLSFVHPDDLVKVREVTHGALSGKEYDIEYRIITPSREVKYVHEKTKAIYDEYQKPVKMVGIIHDITKAKINHAVLSKAQSLAHIGSWQMDVISGKNIMSEEALNIFGLTEDQFSGTYEGFLQYVHPDDKCMIENALTNHRYESSFDMEFRIIHTDGSSRYVYQIVKKEYDSDGRLSKLYGTIQDITRTKELERDLILTKQTFLNDTHSFYEIINPNGTILFINHKWTEDMGYDVNNIVGSNLFDILRKEEATVINVMLKLALENENKGITHNLKLRTKLGNVLNYQVTMINQLSNPNVHGITLYWHDMTEKFNLESKIAYLATHDELTKLPNYIYLRQRFSLLSEEAKRNKDRIALILLDIDGFDYINSGLGYQLGDQLIVSISDRLQNFMNRTNNTDLYHYSGDQFAILMKGFASLQEYEAYVVKLLALFSEAFPVDQYDLNISVNMGISIFPDDGEELVVLLKNANIAMSHSKNLGRNRFGFYSSGMDIQSYKLFKLRNDLQKAVDRNQLRVYYQPIVNLITNEIVATEALIRWEHPTWGLISPMEFIPIAEDTGFILLLGRWILEDICKSYKEWLAQGLPNIKITVNYSGIQFYEKNFVDNIMDTIQKYGLDPSFLVIEIVESVLINDFSKAESDIKKLQGFGIQIALDDFGTGFSSLEYLNRFQIDIIKLDRSFIMNVPADATSSAITETVISLAKKLRIKLVAEGIETWDQLSYLRKLNCVTGQGYLYSKPVSGQDITTLLSKGRCKPDIVNNSKELPFEERRKYFRVEFPLLLEAMMTITEINGAATKVGGTRVLIKNMGPGGLCFLSDIQLPTNKDIILQCITQLIGFELRTYGRIVWKEDILNHIYQYGLQFSFSEKERTHLTSILNQYQIRLRNNNEQYEGSFTYDSYIRFFNASGINGSL